MEKVVGSIFGGGGTDKKAAAEADRQRQLQQVAQARQEEAARVAAAETAGQTRSTGPAPRGRRLLAFTEAGGAGKSDTLGG